MEAQRADILPSDLQPSSHPGSTQGLTNEAPIRWRWLGRVAALAMVAGGVTAIVAGGVAFAVSQSLPKEYDAQSGVIVGSLTATSTDELDAYERLATTYAELASSGPVLTRVINRLSLSDTPVDLAARIDVRATAQGIVLIDATAPAPAQAAQIANTIADEVVRMAQPPVVAVPSPTAIAATPTPTPKPVESEPSTFPKPSESPAASASPTASLGPTASSAPSLATVFQPALPPDSPSSPRVLLNMVIAALLGFALGAGFAVLVVTRNDRANLTRG